ncbi:hypothetical protein FRACYDRAFT_189533 [Fragilariopsis cylindrus CCMP1102]|uniref:2Fe-2S ferredoxin-type domain-containing protein n=1 Tax=Fragilariopsis cylindrus CCMP1102 TaxID=635003 RepID=A0A1E7F670_9STRA|nr:hypothetical protein FRACYDRAFT_189533 [Fragilariopsis cylindrus CCMP1102]|eukprot:OEU13353.1 hypothetical protein FRACYDRAFT_189533 [Fragilariopsis cylindrus CCMP1102]
MAATTQGFSPSSSGTSQQQQRRVSSYTTTTTTTTTTSLNGFGDAFKGAFGNDDSLGEVKNEGLSGGPDYNENVTVNGKKVPKAVVGQKLTVVAGRVRVKIPVNCNQGDCGTCMVKLNGKQVKACQTKVAKGKCAITTL